MRRLAIVSFGAILTTAILATAAVKKSDVTVVNQSLWTIQHLFLSAADQNEWRPDQLGNEVIGTGDSFKIMDIPCDEYDVRLVDEDGDECMVFGVDICGENERWEITSGDLLECEAS